MIWRLSGHCRRNLDLRDQEEKRKGERVESGEGRSGVVMLVTMIVHAAPMIMMSWLGWTWFKVLWVCVSKSDSWINCCEEVAVGNSRSLIPPYVR